MKKFKKRNFDEFFENSNSKTNSSSKNVPNIKKQKSATDEKRIQENPFPLNEKWKTLLETNLHSTGFQKLLIFLQDQRDQDKTIFPPKEKVFAALNNCDPENVQVVIIGQDPYHGKGQACGLCFAVEKGVTVPPSLKNIYKEIKDEYGESFNIPTHGDLTQWSAQGVLLLNSCLTVEEKKPNSHAKKGWEGITNGIISKISEKNENVVFILWGKFAQEKKRYITNKDKHCILECAHPSPFSATQFFGNNHFKQCNEYLLKHDKKQIDWQIN